MRLTTLLLSSLPLALSARLTLIVPASNILPNPSTLPPTTHATLSSSNSVHSAPLNRQNAFVFNNVTSGSYVASVACRDFVFEPLRVDVGDLESGQKIQVWQTFRGNEWDNLGEKKADAMGDALVDVRAVAAKDYYQQRGGFSPMSFLKNPMILMALVSMGLVFGMPKLIENMDDETRAEYEEIRKKGPLGSVGGNSAASLQNFDMASWLAGKSSDSSSGAGTRGGGSRRG